MNKLEKPLIVTYDFSHLGKGDPEHPTEYDRILQLTAQWSERKIQTGDNSKYVSYYVEGGVLGIKIDEPYIKLVHDKEEGIRGLVKLLGLPFVSSNQPLTSSR